MLHVSFVVVFVVVVVTLYEDDLVPVNHTKRSEIFFLIIKFSTAV